MILLSLNRNNRIREEYRIMDENLNLLADELEQNFRNGFCLGVKMMCEVFGKDV